MSRIACLGEQLTLTIGRILLTTLANHFDLTPTADGPREYGGFHWQPSSRFRIRLTPANCAGVATSSMELRRALNHHASSQTPDRINQKSGPFLCAMKPLAI
jgi:hypothetical protein